MVALQLSDKKILKALTLPAFEKRQRIWKIQEASRHRFDVCGPIDCVGSNGSYF